LSVGEIILSEGESRGGEIGCLSGGMYINDMLKGGEVGRLMENFEDNIVVEKVTWQSAVNGSFEPFFCAYSWSALFNEGVNSVTFEHVGKFDNGEEEKQFDCWWRCFFKESSIPSINLVLRSLISFFCLRALTFWSFSW